MIVVVVIKDADGNIVHERIVYGLESAAAGEPIDMDAALEISDSLAALADDL